MLILYSITWRVKCFGKVAPVTSSYIKVGNSICCIFHCGGRLSQNGKCVKHTYICKHNIPHNDNPFLLRVSFEYIYIWLAERWWHCDIDEVIYIYIIRSSFQIDWMWQLNEVSNDFFCYTYIFPFDNII